MRRLGPSRLKARPIRHAAPRNPTRFQWKPLRPGPVPGFFMVCRACSTAWRWKSSTQSDGGEGLAKRKGVAARRGLREACPERHGGNHAFVLIPDEEGLAWGCVSPLMGSG